MCVCVFVCVCMRVRVCVCVCSSSSSSSANAVEDTQNHMYKHTIKTVTFIHKANVTMK